MFGGPHLQRIWEDDEPILTTNDEWRRRSAHVINEVGQPRRKKGGVVRSFGGETLGL
jgi:hypothetical protein